MSTPEPTAIRPLRSKAAPSGGRTHSPKDVAKCMALLASSYTVEEVAADMKLSLEQARELAAQVLSDEELRVVGRRREEVFADYTLRTRGMMRELDEVIVELRSSRQGNAVVGAITAKHKLMDRVIERGQDFGFIERKPSQHAVVVAKLDDKGLGELVAAELTAMRTLLAGGGVPFLEVEAAARPPAATPVVDVTEAVVVPAPAGPVRKAARPGLPAASPSPAARPTPPPPAFAPPLPGTGPAGATAEAEAMPASVAGPALARVRPVVVRQRVAES